MNTYKKEFSEKLFIMSKGSLTKEQCDIISDNYTNKIFSDKSYVSTHKSMEFYIKNILEDLKCV